MSFDKVTQNETRIRSLNPFGTGQCLSTSIRQELNLIQLSQSLWNRAMSFDLTQYNPVQSDRSQSLWNRAMSFDIQCFKK